MVINKLKLFLASSSATTALTAAFLAGKYHESSNCKEKIEQFEDIFNRKFNNFSIDQADFPIFALASKQETWSPLATIISLTNRILSQNFCRIDAASPNYEPSQVSAVTKPSVSRITQIMKYGYPGLDNVISYSDYVLSYDRRNRVAHWVFEHLTAESVKGNDKVDRSTCNFIEADHVHPYFRSHNSDYKGSGYDRGHLAAAGNHKSSQKCIEDTFYLTNMAPQVGKGFNRDSWNRLEKYVRRLTRTYCDVYCCTGPLYLPRKESNGKMYVKYEVIGAQHVAVPTHFYKVVVGKTKTGQLEMECYVMENAVIDNNIPLNSFQVPLELIERASGLLFFDNVLKTNISKINGRKM